MAGWLRQLALLKPGHQTPNPGCSANGSHLPLQQILGLGREGATKWCLLTFRGWSAPLASLPKPASSSRPLVCPGERAQHPSAVLQAPQHCGRETVPMFRVGCAHMGEESWADAGCERLWMSLISPNGTEEQHAALFLHQPARGTHSLPPG